MDIEKLYHSQMQTFGLARDNYAYLREAVCRTIPVNGFEFRIQYNPSRILSTNAKVDPAAIKERKCFLCPGNMPEEQSGVPYGEQYKIFINPYPIFEKHFTVPAVNHSPQLISGHFEDLLSLAFDFPDYTVFYNGPQCGASAPDHFHFQMAPRHTMPLEQDVENGQIIQTLVQSDYYSLSTVRDYLRRVLILKASDFNILSDLFHKITTLLKIPGEEAEEPRFNLLAWFDNAQCTVCLFPRETLRPRQFFAEGSEKVLFSPGCVDMAGLIIAPRKEDFEKYNPELLADLLGQVTLNEAAWQKLCGALTQIFNVIK